jgi:hypothetical protein
MDKKSGFGIRIRDEQPGPFIRELRILKFFEADPESGIRDG